MIINFEFLGQTFLGLFIISGILCTILYFLYEFIKKRSIFTIVYVLGCIAMNSFILWILMLAINGRDTFLIIGMIGTLFVVNLGMQILKPDSKINPWAFQNKKLIPIYLLSVSMIAIVVIGLSIGENLKSAIIGITLGIVFSVAFVLIDYRNNLSTWKHVGFVRPRTPKEHEILLEAYGDKLYINKENKIIFYMFLFEILIGIYITVYDNTLNLPEIFASMAGSVLITIFLFHIILKNLADKRIRKLSKDRVS